MLETSRNCNPNGLSWQVTMRFGTVLLACVLLAFSGGQALSRQMADVCYLFGLTGMACYFCLELVAEQRERRHSRTLSQLAEKRLSVHLRKDHNVSNHNQPSPREQSDSGTVESAMDSSVDMEFFLPPVSQPTLSV